MRICRIENRSQAQNLTRDNPADDGAGERSDPANHHHHKRIHQYPVPHVRLQGHNRRIDDAGETRGHCSDPENQQESTLDVNAQSIRSEEHTSELQSLMRISYAVFCLKKKKTSKHDTIIPDNRLTTT